VRPPPWKRSLNAPGSHGFDDPVAEENVDDDGRSDADHGGGEGQRIVGSVGRQEITHTHLHRLSVGVRGQDRREKQFVESRDEQEDASRYRARRCEWYDDAEEDCMESGAVESRRLEDRLRRSVHIGLDDQKAERKEHPGVETSDRPTTEL